ncbi:MAG: MlaD family protein [Nitrococcus sp.]|nr:MlaD family protein [Nitrococcus sp.]
MGSRVSYTLVGLFVVVLAVGLVAAALWFSGGLQDAASLQYYSVYTTESVAGVNTGARVTYKGVHVGRVADIAIDRRNPKRIQLVLAIEQSTPVSAATVATLQLHGLTGATSVELSGYDPSAPPPATPVGEPYPVIQSGKSLLTQVDKAITQGIGTLNQIAEQVNALLSEHNRQALTDILSNLARLTGTLASNSENIDQILAHVQEITQNTAQITARLPKSLEKLDRLSQKLSQTAESLTALGHSGQTALNQMLRTTLPKLDALFAEIRQTASHIDRLVQEIERDPAVLLRGTNRRAAGPGEE